MSEFRDAIHYAVNLNSDGPNDGDAVLAMPEVEAIRAALRAVTTPYHFISPREMLGCPPYNLPESVIAWVLSDD